MDWDYEALFNRIDAIKENFSLPVYRDKEWIQELHAGVEKTSMKLQEHYDKNGISYVYPDACILEIFGKLGLFKTRMFSSLFFRKRQREESSDDEEEMDNHLFSLVLL